MSFIPPNIFDGMLIWCAIYFIPLMLCGVFFLYGVVKDIKTVRVATVLLIACCIIFSSYVWFDTMEVPSVQEKVITVQEWQPSPNVKPNGFGQMTIDNADQLVLVTTDGETFQNTEHFFFMKFETRDILNHLKPGGTYKIKYYGWRNGWTSSFPNILSIEEVVDDSSLNVTNSYFGTRIV